MLNWVFVDCVLGKIEVSRRGVDHVQVIMAAGLCCIGLVLPLLAWEIVAILPETEGRLYLWV